MPPAIRVEGLSKLYRIGTRKQAYHTLRETLSEAGQAAWRSACRAAARAAHAWRANGRSPAIPAATGVLPTKAVLGTDGAEGRLDTTPRLEGDHFWALKDVSFEVQPGEVVGIIGRNGAGKSTLLKILSRITEPTAGRVELRGRVGSLLEVGTGFHPELTGRENIYLNGSILGMSRREIQRKFDEIVAFAEIDDFLDTPVKRYSSGMYVRLAFAVAAHLEPEILIVDEVLAVGDAAFQQKCLAKLKTFGHRGITVLFVSHNMHALMRLATVAIYLDAGRMRQKGAIRDVAWTYLHHNTYNDPYLNGSGYLATVRLLDRYGRPAAHWIPNQDLVVAVTIHKTPVASAPEIDIALYTDDGARITAITSASLLGGRPPPPRPPFTYNFIITNHNLSCPSAYVDVGIREKGDKEYRICWEKVARVAISTSGLPPHHVPYTIVTLPARIEVTQPL